MVMENLGMVMEKYFVKSVGTLSRIRLGKAFPSFPSFYSRISPQGKNSITYKSVIITHTDFCPFIISRFISFPEFQAFEALLCSPESVYALAFQLFDSNGSGAITYGQLNTSIFCRPQVIKESYIDPHLF